MCMRERQVGLAIIAFGAGILLSILLPSCLLRGLIGIILIVIGCLMLHA